MLKRLIKSLCAVLFLAFPALSHAEEIDGVLKRIYDEANRLYQRSPSLNSIEFILLPRSQITSLNSLVIAPQGGPFFAALESCLFLRRSYIGRHFTEAEQVKAASAFRLFLERYWQDGSIKGFIRVNTLSRDLWPTFGGSDPAPCAFGVITAGEIFLLRGMINRP